MTETLESRVRAAWKGIDGRDCLDLATRTSIPELPQGITDQVTETINEEYAKQIQKNECENLPAKPIATEKPPKDTGKTVLTMIVAVVILGILIGGLIYWIDKSKKEKLQEQLEAVALANTFPAGYAYGPKIFTNEILISTETNGTIEESEPETEDLKKPLQEMSVKSGARGSFDASKFLLLQPQLLETISDLTIVRNT
jgi:hypothetical protein